MIIIHQRVPSHFFLISMIKVRNDYGQPVSSEAIGAGSVEIIPCHTS